MTVTRIQFHVRTGYRDFMRESGIEELIRESVQRTADAAGDGFEAEVESRSGRRQVPRGAVFTATFEAKRRQARDHVLERAIDAGR